MLLSAASSASQAGEPRADAASLLSIGTKNTPPAVATAHQQAVALKRARPNDERVDYTYGLVLANQRRYRDACFLIARYLKSRPDDLAARRVLVWTAIEGDQYSSILDLLDEAGARLVLPAGGKASAEHVETARFLGICFGYLELIQVKEIDVDTLERKKSALIARLGDDQVRKIDEGRKLVAEQLAQLEGDRDSRLKRAEEAAAEKSKQAAAELKELNSRVASQREVLQESTADARDAQRELATIQQQLSTMAQDRARVTAQLITLQAQLAQVQSPSSITTTNQVVGNRPNDPTVRPGDVYQNTRVQSQTRVSLDQYAQANALGLTLAAFNKQAFDMDRKILALQTRGAELTGVSRDEFKTAMESKAAAEKAAKKAERLEKQLNRAESTARSRPAGPTGRMTQFSTYAPLPYEQETKRVLGWFEK